MHLSEFCVKRPVFAAVINLIIVVLGIIAWQRLPVREFPNINPPIVSVETNYRGASASVVDSKITQQIEDRISGIEGVRSITSSSVDGRSSISIEFMLNRDIDAAANDVRERISRVVEDLPVEADPPEIYKVDSGSDVIMWQNLGSDTLSGLELTDYANRFLVDRLGTVPGVARVRVGGARDYSMRVWLNREAMAARAITTTDIEDALRRENVELPAGRVDSQDRSFTVRTERLYQTADDFKKLVVGKGTDGHLIRLGEVANVVIGAVEYRQELRGNAQDMVGLGIEAQSTANNLEVAKGVKAEIARLAPTLPPGTQFYDSYDTTVFIEKSLDGVFRSLIEALVLVVAVIFFFLGNFRAVMVPAIAVPISLIGSLAFLYFMGFSINLLTLLAMLLAIGLVVDDAIVVLENVYRRIHLGESSALAAVRGTKQVSFAVIATTLVLIAVFVPIGFLSGNTGRLFSEFAFAIAASVAISSIVALTLSPVMCSYFLSSNQAESWLGKTVDRTLNKVALTYRKSLAFALNHGGIVATVILVSIGVSVFFYKRLPQEFTPREDRGAFFVVMTAPEGSSYEYSQRYMREIEGELMPLVDKGEATRILIRTPGTFGNPDSFNSGRAVVVLSDWDERERKDTQIMAEVRGKLDRLAGVRAFPVARTALSNSAGDPVQFVIGGSTYEELREWRDIILEAARENPFLLNVDSDFKETKPQLKVAIDSARAADLGVPVSEIGRTLETFFGSRRVTTFLDRGEEYDVILQGADTDRQSFRDLENIYVRSANTGQLIPLSNLVELTETADAPSLNRFNRLRAVTITASLAEGYSLGEALTYMETAVRERLPTEAQIDYKGESREFKDSQGAIYFVLALALTVVFLVLAAQFESFLHPITVMVTVPLAAAGAFAGLYFTGNSLNIFSQIGIVMLIGLAAKNGILIVEFANQLRDQGRELREAILTASQLRLRPILMTAISTVLGAIPLVMATGAGAENRIAIGVVVVCGVSGATFLTLYCIPFVYEKIGQFTGSPGVRAAKIDAEAREMVFKE